MKKIFLLPFLSCNIYVTVLVLVGAGALLFGIFSCAGNTNSNVGSSSTVILSSISSNMITVTGGTFTMGCIREQGSDCDSVEEPAHQVTVGNFKLGTYEVTQEQYREVMGTNPSYFYGCDNCPVEQVSWNDIQEFIRKLNNKTGKNFRLPTEAEWEYAARGGNQSRGYKYSGSDEISNIAWYADNSERKTHTIGVKQANELGIYDMSGNVWEWCADWYGTYGSNSQTNPTGAHSGEFRVVRGGSWVDDADGCRVFNRYCVAPDFIDSYDGFRLAQDLQP